MPQSELVVSLNSFVKELALAWQKLSIYQPGHPERQQALDRAHAVLAGLVAPTGSLALGVSRDSLLGPDEKLKSAPAVRLAAALYLLEVAVLRFSEGVESEELEHLLGLLPRGEVRGSERSLGTELEAHGVRHIVVEAVDFTGLLATETLDAPEEGSGEDSLWDRILQRLLSDGRLFIESRSLEESGPSPFVQIQAAVDQVLQQYGVTDGEMVSVEPDPKRAEIETVLEGIVGQTAGEALAEIDDEGEEEGGQLSTARHVSELLSAMPDGMRQGILDAAVRELVGREDAVPGLKSLGSAVSAAKMVGSLRRLRADDVIFAPRVVSVVDSLVIEASPERLESRQRQEPEALATELRSVFSDEDIDRAPLSGALDDRVFVELRRHVPVHAMFSDLSPYLETITDQRLDVDLSMMLIDLLQRPFLDDEQITSVISRQQETFKAMLAGGRFGPATRIVEALREMTTSGEQIKPVREAAERCLEGLREPNTLSGIVDVLGEVKKSDIGQVHQLIELLGPTSIHQLLCVLGEESELSRRRHIFDLLVSLGSSVVPASVALLDDSQWYMIRNILSLLRRVGEGLTLEVLQKGLAHEDSRVRIEAVKCIPDLGGDITPELVEKVLSDDDLKVSEMAVGVFGSAGIGAATAPLVDLLRRPDPIGRQRRLRLRALQTLGQIGDAGVLPEIAQFFRSWFALVSTEERHAAFRSLGLYPENERRPWVKKGRLSPDATVRAICRDLENGTQSGTGR